MLCLYVNVGNNKKKQMSTKKSQANLLNHSKAKVRLFGDYIQKYLNIISNDGYTKSIYIYLICFAVLVFTKMAEKEAQLLH